MIESFPRKIANKAILTYVSALALITLMYFNMAMEFKFIVFGVVEVCVFFLASSSLSKSWSKLSPKDFESKVFWTAFWIRIAWVIFSYFFYMAQNGEPFEWGAADSRGYHEEAQWLSLYKWDFIWQYRDMARSGVSDAGYSLYLTVLYKIFGSKLFIARLFKALWSAWTCKLVYRLSYRTFGGSIARLASLFCIFMPNLIYYCGIHTKETEMVFCAMMFLERADYVIRYNRTSFRSIIVPIAFATSLFFFRTVLGIVAYFSFLSALLLSPDHLGGKQKRKYIVGWVVAGAIVIAGGTIMNEIEKYWNLRVVNSVAKREYQSETSRWAEYATGAVMAPMIFTLPFSTMVDTGQYNQNIIHGGAFVKNYLSIFVFMALYYAFKNKKLREFMLLGSFIIAYLGIIAFSGYANAERFHMPALPVFLIMAAYGIFQINRSNIKWVNRWSAVVVLMEFAWTFFKLGSRGLI